MKKSTIFVWFLKNQTTFEATSGGWLRSMISHFYGLRLVHLGMPHSASFLPQNSPVMSFGTYAFKGFLPLLPIFCHLFTAERLQLLCCSTPKNTYWKYRRRPNCLWPCYKALGMRAQIICINLVNPGNTGRPYISIILLGLLKMLKDVGVMNRPPMTSATDGDA